jgi:hypothetical protein
VLIPSAHKTTLFLLLAFRTNSCYDRWWEGRKQLDGVLGRMALLFVAPVNQQMLSWVIVIAHAIKWNLRRRKVSLPTPRRRLLGGISTSLPVPTTRAPSASVYLRSSYSAPQQPRAQRAGTPQLN